MQLSEDTSSSFQNGNSSLLVIGKCFQNAVKTVGRPSIGSRRVLFTGELAMGVPQITVEQGKVVKIMKKLCELTNACTRGKWLNILSQLRKEARDMQPPSNTCQLLSCFCNSRFIQSVHHSFSSSSIISNSFFSLHTFITKLSCKSLKLSIIQTSICP